MKWFLSKALHEEITRDNITKHRGFPLFIHISQGNIDLNKRQGEYVVGPSKDSTNKKHKYCSQQTNHYFGLKANQTDLLA